MSDRYHQWKDEQILAHAEANPEEWTPEAIQKQRDRDELKRKTTKNDYDQSRKMLPSSPK